MNARKACVGILAVLLLAIAGCEQPAEHFDAASTQKRQADKDYREGHNGPKPGTVK